MVTFGRGCLVTDIQLVEARDDAKYTIECSTTPATKNDLIPNTKNAKANISLTTEKIHENLFFSLLFLEYFSDLGHFATVMLCDMSCQWYVNHITLVPQHKEEYGLIIDPLSQYLELSVQV